MSSAPTFDLRREQLPNGVTLLVQRRSAVPAVALVTHVRAGFLDESDEVVGISHVLEHMLFKGTPTLAPGELAQRTKALGGSLNAYTSYDRTVYYASVPARHAQELIALQADQVRNPLLDADELRRELGVIIQEARRKLDSPDAVAGETLHELLFATHRLRRWRIGSEAMLERFGRDDVAGYYTSRYVPARVIVALVGDLDEATALDALRATWGDWTRPEQPIPAGPVETSAAAVTARRLDGDVVLAQLVLGWRAPGVLDADASRPRRRHRDSRRREGLAIRPAASRTRPGQCRRRVELRRGGCRRFLHWRRTGSGATPASRQEHRRCRSRPRGAHPRCARVRTSHRAVAGADRAPAGALRKPGTLACRRRIVRGRDASRSGNVRLACRNTAPGPRCGARVARGRRCLRGGVSARQFGCAVRQRTAARRDGAVLADLIRWPRGSGGGRRFARRGRTTARPRSTGRQSETRERRMRSQCTIWRRQDLDVLDRAIRRNRPGDAGCLPIPQPVRDASQRRARGTGDPGDDAWHGAPRRGCARVRNGIARRRDLADPGRGSSRFWSDRPRRTRGARGRRCSPRCCISLASTPMPFQSNVASCSRMRVPSPTTWCAFRCSSPLVLRSTTSDTGRRRSAHRDLSRRSPSPTCANGTQRCSATGARRSWPLGTATRSNLPTQ